MLLLSIGRTHISWDIMFDEEYFLYDTTSRQSNSGTIDGLSITDLFVLLHLSNPSPFIFLIFHHLNPHPLPSYRLVGYLYPP